MHRLLLSTLVATLAGFAYLNTLHNPFVYDDKLTVVGNPSLRTPGDLHALLHRSVFRPVVNLSYAFDYALGGFRPFGFHLSSVIWHMTNVALLFWVAAIATDDWRRRDPMRAGTISADVVALAAASLLAVHPLMTEAVGYVSSRSEVLCAAFMAISLLALRAALVRDRAWWVVPGLAAAFLAVGSKETGLMLPFVLFAWDRLLLAPTQPQDRRRLRWLSLALIGVWGIAGVVRLAVFVWVEPPSPTPLVPYLTAQVPGVWRYVGMLVAPVSQSLVHPAEPMRVITAATWLGALGLAGGISTVIVGRRREPVAALGIVWFLLFLLPSSLVPLPEVMAEHRIYAASSGIFLAMGAAWGRLDGSLAHRSRRRRAAAAGALGLVLATLCVLTVARNAIWANPVVLWQDAAQKAPRSWRAHFGMANALAEAGNCHDAIPEFDQALRLEAHAPIFMNLATCLAAERRVEEAARAYEAAFAVKPGYVPAHFNLALLALGAGDRGVAQRHFLQAVTTDTRDGAWQEFLLRTHMVTIDDPALTLEMCRKVHDVAPETPNVRECLRNEGRR